MSSLIRLCFCLGLVVAVHLDVPTVDAEEVNFSRDILPVLSDRCFHCHGPDPDNREADLRLDIEENAKEDLGGYWPVAEGNLDDSELWNRITSNDEDEVMPPVDSHRKPISDRERELIRKWILAGAKWGKHWSFEMPIQLPLPVIDETADAPDPIDAFVKERLHQEGWKLSPRAKPAKQLRRLSFALTGLPPSPEQVQRFVSDPTDQAWQAAITEMLASPRHAERMAMWWLDSARYSDTDGFQLDESRENWPWRDGVIDAFQNNMPFDEFTIEQFAGDLLPDATPEQILATCFHRNHMTNGEGGRDPNESRVDYVIDRVNTTGTVWLGLTLGCVQCHTHKFDPITHHDYYSFSAFFNSIDEDGRAGKSAKPYLKYTSNAVEERIAETQQFVDQCQAAERQSHGQASSRFDQWLEQLITDPPKDYQAWQVPVPSPTSSDGTRFQVESDQTIQTIGPTPRQDDYRIELAIPEGMERITGWRLEIFPNPNQPDAKYARSGEGDFILTSVRALSRSANSPAEREIEIKDAHADKEASKPGKRLYGKISDTLNDDARNGWTTEGEEERQTHIGVFRFTKPYPVAEGDRLQILLRHRSNGSHVSIGRFRLSLTDETGETATRTDGRSPIGDLLDSRSAADNSDKEPRSQASKIYKDPIDPKIKKRLLDQFLAGDAEYQTSNDLLKVAKAQLKNLQAEQKERSVMVLKEREKPRPTYVLLRGVWDAHGDVVKPAVLPSVLPWDPDRTQSRLDLANWLIDPQNPLTARVIVNQLWQLMFGQGIVRTPGDFGLQGEFPTHPELLDWLAIELIQHDWDPQHILRQMVTSETFRQSSKVTPDQLERDPENRLLARAPKHRLPAWMLRDNALAVSGLLNPAIGGPPVYPYQPDGIWNEITMGRFRYQPSLGPAQYRRTLYAFWRRASAPTFLFDSAQRRVCEVDVRLTNTPLQALTLMNDVGMLEAARVLADSVVGRNNDSPKSAMHEGIAQLANRILSRTLSETESESVETLWQRAHDHFETHPEVAARYTTVGQQPTPDATQVADTAAWMTVANLIMNLDEAISYE
ncbi:PSD1 and planctomycete cytochrome C domain-containing protein [Neorhodopirellula lusitana]|uniref:PSD1 and planctomycete cytochrome C domain-containing protein n=1 Tax=Neorhodopirellula lusitana TaxID=445327 RepID=UPI0038509460